MGACIDIFHKDPSHQRKIPGDPRNLAHQAMIELDPEPKALFKTDITEQVRQTSGDPHLTSIGRRQ